jgi:hypothetical protein
VPPNPNLVVLAAGADVVCRPAVGGVLLYLTLATLECHIGKGSGVWSTMLSVCIMQTVKHKLALPFERNYNKYRIS